MTGDRWRRLGRSNQWDNGEGLMAKRAPLDRIDQPDSWSNQNSKCKISLINLKYKCLKLQSFTLVTRRVAEFRCARLTLCYLLGFGVMPFLPIKNEFTW